MRLSAAQQMMSALDAQGRIVSCDRQAAIEAFYHDCPVDLADEAIRHLRPQALRPFIEPMPRHLGRTWRCASSITGKTVPRASIISKRWFVSVLASS
jgi:hypothetical protein